MGQHGGEVNIRQGPWDKVWEYIRRTSGQKMTRRKILLTTSSPSPIAMEESSKYTKMGIKNLSLEHSLKSSGFRHPFKIFYYRTTLCSLAKLVGIQEDKEDISFIFVLSNHFLYFSKHRFHTQKINTIENKPWWLCLQVKTIK